MSRVRGRIDKPLDSGPQLAQHCLPGRLRLARVAVVAAIQDAGESACVAGFAKHALEALAADKSCLGIGLVQNLFGVGRRQRVDPVAEPDGCRHWIEHMSGPGFTDQACLESHLGVPGGE